MGNSLLQQWVDTSSRIVFFGGAGVSTESGIPDFRGQNGIFSALKRYHREPETLLSLSFFKMRPDVFYEYYREDILVTDAEPNPAHLALAALEAKGILKAVVTQNIDGLHQKAGSRRVLELHGSIYRNYCMKCGKRYGVEAILGSEGVPHCECGGIIRPDVVLYEEMLPEDIFNEAERVIMEADMLIVGGTSLSVYPAAGLLRCFRRERLVLINKSETPYDDRADLVIREPIGEVFAGLNI